MKRVLCRCGLESLTKKVLPQPGKAEFVEELEAPDPSCT